MSNAWIQTYTGREFPLLEPSPEDIDIADIAHALSNLCRFAGHTKQFYSVAQHSMLVSYHVPPELALQALLHDAPEAYIVDVPRPLKHSGMIDGYHLIEDRVWIAVADRFGVSRQVDAKVKIADNRALFTEQRDLMQRPPKAWQDPHEPFNEVIHPLNPLDAECFFLQRFIELFALHASQSH